MITEQDYLDAAGLLRCDPAAIKAVAEVESNGCGFLQDGRLRVLFEGHVFHKLTKGKFAKSHPTLCYPKWTKANYCKGSAEARGAGELARLEQARALDPDAALMSCSVGRFQIMGFNYALCGLSTVQQFWDTLATGEDEHLRSFCHFVKNMKLDGAMRTHDWVTFALRYNGPGYAANKYDVKLGKAYAHYV